jgi:hypothetical protein
MKQSTQVLKNAVVLLLAQLLCWQTCFSQVDPWERVELIEQGKKVAVTLHSGKTVNGKMEGWSTDGLGVRQGKNKVVPVAKSDVAQVSLLIGRSRWSRAGRTALIAFGVMAGLIGLAGATGGCSGLGASGCAYLGAAPPVIAGIAAAGAADRPQDRAVIYMAAASTPGDPAPR